MSLGCSITLNPSGTDSTVVLWSRSSAANRYASPVRPQPGQVSLAVNGALAMPRIWHGGAAIAPCGRERPQPFTFQTDPLPRDGITRSSPGREVRVGARSFVERDDLGRAGVLGVAGIADLVEEEIRRRDDPRDLA